MCERKDLSCDEIITELHKRNATDELISLVGEKMLEMKGTSKLDHILSWTVNDVMSLGVNSKEECMLFLNVLDGIKGKYVMDAVFTSPQSCEVFLDPIYGHIALHPACLMIVDTPEFQRLREIKQLGLVYYQELGATHSCFEHSIGVCYLAGQLAKSLQKFQPELNITDVDILCIEIAGLCQNLGQGPFSRLFVKKFLPSIEPNIKFRKPSSEMFQHLLHINGLISKLRSFGVEARDLTFIQELMTAQTRNDSLQWPYRGRTREKSFLYEIIKNKRNGMDVRKWDYVARDCHHLGRKVNYSAASFIMFSRVLRVDGELQICIAEEEIINFCNMVCTLHRLREEVVYDATTRGLERMVVQVLQKANRHLKFQGKEKRPCTMYDCYSDMEALTILTDKVLCDISSTALDGKQPEDHIERKRWKDLKEAKHILSRIYRNDFFTCVCEKEALNPDFLQSCMENNTEVREEALVQSILRKITDKDFLLQYFEAEKKTASKEELTHMVNETITYFTRDNAVFVEFIHLDFGIQKGNPWTKLKVFSKQDPNKARDLKKEKIWGFVGFAYTNKLKVRVYSSDREDEKCNIIAKATEEILRVW